MSLSASPVLGVSHSRRLPRGVPAFLHRVLSVAVIQICREAGYERSQSSALDTLCELLHQFIREVGAAAKAGAELANRQRVNAADVMQALDGLQQSALTLMEYRQHSDALPFYHALPHFPTPRPLLKLQPALPPDAASAASLASLYPHIPPFLPALPDEHTYIATPTITKPEQAGSSESRKRRSEQSRAAEQSLSRIAQLERQRQSEALANGTAAMNGSKQEQEDDADDEDDRPTRRSAALTDPSLHVPLIAPIASGQREQERAAAIAKNPFAAPPLPPAPPAPPPPPPVEQTAAPVPSPRPQLPPAAPSKLQSAARPLTPPAADDGISSFSAANADAPAVAAAAPTAAAIAPSPAVVKAEDGDVDII